VRFRSAAVDGVTVFAVTGVNTVSFGLRVSVRARRGLLGFAVQRRAPGGRWRYVEGFKVFRSVVPDPEPGASHSTHAHPIQSLVWDDFTVQAGTAYGYRFIPVRGTPAQPAYGRPVAIEVSAEPRESEVHDIHFNRGVASSQFYARRFGNLRPDELATPALRQLAMDWLSRDLDEALIAFIRSAGPGDALRGAFYEFSYGPVLSEFRAAIDRGVDVQLVIDLKENEHWENKKQDDGTRKRTWVESTPRVANLAAIVDAGLPDTALLPRVNRRAEIQHNKFLVLVRAGSPVAVWTGSTNLTTGGIHGQSNVGHLVRDSGLAADFLAYFSLLANDPGARPGEGRSENIERNREYESAVLALSPTPAARSDIGTGCRAIFSPRPGPEPLALYADLLAHPQSLACATFAFGIAQELKDVLAQGDSSSPLRFFLLETPDRTRPGAPRIELDASKNIYQAWGSELGTPLGQWVAETTTRELGLNVHVAFIHNKFLLSDPLGDDPIVVTGSANFSRASCVDNDENMVVIRGDRRVADIYFTEFNRLFFHYYFRSVVESRSRTDRAGARRAAPAALDLSEDDRWLENYGPGSLRTKRAEQFITMSGARLSLPAEP